MPSSLWCAGPGDPDWAPPRRIDLMTEISGLEFEQAWARRVTHTVGSLAVPFLSREDLVRNKRASGRSKDLADLQVLERQQL